MRLQLYASAHDFTVIGTAVVRTDRLARTYVGGVRVVVDRPEGMFTVLRCADGRTLAVMTTDWQAAQRLPAEEGPENEGQAVHS
jgi:hypothetical protein